MRRKIGFIGLGNMGNPMAENLIAAGYDLTVYDAFPAAIEKLTEVGATAAADPQAAAESSEIVILSLPNSRIIENVVLGEKGAINGLKPGTILIDMSSAEPSSTKKICAALKEKGVDMLDAAISGGPAGEATKKMSIMVGGDPDVFEKYRYILEELGNNVFLVGSNGAGHCLKSVNNLLYGAIFVATCEAITLGKKAGLDLKTMLDVISVSAGRNFAVDVKFKTNVTNRDWNPGFSLDLLRKDMAIATKMADELHFPVSLCQYAQDILTEGQAAGYGPLDHTAVLQKYEKIAGITVE